MPFDTYYRQYVTPELIALVEHTFHPSTILAAADRDPHFLTLEPRLGFLAPNVLGDHFTHAEKILILKHALRASAGIQ
jgi:hypothetical protein